MKFNLQNYTRWRIDAAGCAACAALTIAAYVLVMRPMAAAQDLRLQHQGNVATHQAKKEKLSTAANALRHDLNRLQKSAAQAPVVLQSAQHSNQRLADLTQLAVENSLDVHEMRLLGGDETSGGKSAAPANQPFAIVRIHMAGSGTFQSCVAYLHHLRQSFRDTGVTAIELSDNPADVDAKTMFRFELAWFTAIERTPTSTSNGAAVATATDRP